MFSFLLWSSWGTHQWKSSQKTGFKLQANFSRVHFDSEHFRRTWWEPAKSLQTLLELTRKSRSKKTPARFAFHHKIIITKWIVSIVNVYSSSIVYRTPTCCGCICTYDYKNSTFTTKGLLEFLFNYFLFSKFLMILKPCCFS